MTTVLEEPATGTSASAAQRLRTTMAAVRLSVHWLGVRKTLSDQQKAQAADAFGAEGDFLSAGKKLLDTRHPAFKAVTAVKNKAVSLWKALTLPYPEAGIRPIRQDDVELFSRQIGWGIVDAEWERVKRGFLETEAVDFTLCTTVRTLLPT